MIKLNNEIIKESKTEYDQKAIDFLNKTKTNMYINFTECVKDPWRENSTTWHNQYKVIITRNKKRITLTFTDSAYNTENYIAPTAYDILACLTKYDPDTFENFCSEYGYEEDSRKAYKTYQAVCKEYAGVERVFGDVIEELQEIE